MTRLLEIGDRLYAKEKYCEFGDLRVITIVRLTPKRAKVTIEGRPKNAVYELLRELKPRSTSWGDTWEAIWYGEPPLGGWRVYLADETLDRRYALAGLNSNLFKSVNDLYGMIRNRDYFNQYDGIDRSAILEHVQKAIELLKTKE